MGSSLTLPPPPADRSVGEAVAAVLSPDCRRAPTVAAKAASLRAAIAAFYRANEDEWLMFHDFQAKFGGRLDSIRAVLHGMVEDGLLKRDRCLDRKGHVSYIYYAGPAL